MTEPDFPSPTPLPEPSEHVIDAPPVDAPPVDAPPVDTPSVKTKKNKTSPTGEVWDKSIHESPARIATRTGTWARKRGGAASGHQSIAEPVDDPTLNNSAAVAEDVDYDALGNLAASTSFSVAQVLGGEDFKAEDGEEASLAKAFTSYLRAKKIADIPPGWGLALAAISIIGKRLPRPTVRSRLKHLYVTVTEWISWLRAPIRD